jgi:hypothetical protein
MRPTTMEQAVRIFLGVLDEDQREALRRTAPAELIWLHPSMGQLIREEFGLWDGNDELLAAAGAQHPDDASMAILLAAHQALQQGQAPKAH